MSTVKDKWKRSFKKALTRKDSHESIGSIASSISVLDEETDEMELHSYINSMKKKTGLLNLWSGNKFENIIENDKTPDISIDSDDDDMLNSKIRNLQMIGGLDSDEDEMRIDYLREMKMKDENNNNAESESSESLNLMGNVQFAELALNDFSLSDNELSKEDDYLPILNEPMKLEKSQRSSTDDSYDFNKNIHILNNSISENTDQSDNTKRVSLDRMMKNDLSLASPVYTEDEISEMSEHRSDVYSDNSTKSNNSKGSFTNKSRSTKSGTYKSLSRNTDNSKSSKKTKKSSSKTSSSTKVSKSDDSATLSDATFSSRTMFDVSSDTSKHSTHQKERKKSKSKSKHKNNIQTQTDYTDQVLNFKYNWQTTEPSNIAAHVVDPMAIEVLTNYNPAVLAANDMMKYHMELLTKHIQNSRRLYEAYAAESVNGNYKYTTVEDTFGYIERNKPKVLTYKQALKKVKGVND